MLTDFEFALLSQNVWIVTFGTTLGHSFCTMLAVLSGRWISQHISVKHGESLDGLALVQNHCLTWQLAFVLIVTLGGAVLFLLFGVIYSYEGYYFDEATEGAQAAALKVASEVDVL